MPDSSRRAVDASRRLFPIPEARALKGTELFPATRQALKELLRDLRAAVESSANRPKHEMLSTSFLVSGDRGFGKTTIFLTAAAAIENVEAYASLVSDQEAPTEQAKAEVLRELARRVTWLETLDLEPVPRGANLLAAVLVRIRDALEKETSGPSGDESSESILGGHIEKTWEQLDRLVQDATFMWEETSHMNDPRRERAQQQIKAAEIFSSFQRNFTNALDRVAVALSKFTSRRDPVLVLPIDNVDRSIEHIYSIVKLCRLASSPRLWFVLAAGRPDFQLFLERSFQQEMSSAAGRLHADDRDDDLSIARRQASTTMRRALPRGHQVQIEAVNPETAWTTTEDGYDSLPDLLGRVRLPGTVGSRLTLLRLFDIRDRVDQHVVAPAYRKAYEEAGGQESSRLEPTNALLTHAARMALLNLSPRALRDLKRSIDPALRARGSDEAAQKKLEVGSEKAVQILVDQLRSAIDESILPFWASEQLHNRILREDMHGNLVLDLRGSPVQQLKQTHLGKVVSFGPEVPARVRRPPDVVFSDVHLRKFDDIVLELLDLDSPRRRVPLPADVAGWFMLLHDLLRTFPAPRVISGGVMAHDPVLSPELIVTRHELAVNREQVWLEFGWTLPEWDTFLDFSIFTIQWRAFLQHLEELLLGERELDPPVLLRLVRAAWVEDVCSVCGEWHGGWTWDNLSKVFDAGSVAEYERCVGGVVEKLKARSFDAEARGRPERQPIDQRRLARAGEWFRRSLPVLLDVEQSVGVFQEIEDESVRDGPGVTLHRHQMVREVAMRSSAYKTLLERGLVKERESWLRSVSDAWFGPAERRHRERRWDGMIERRKDGAMTSTTPP